MYRGEMGHMDDENGQPVKTRQRSVRQRLLRLGIGLAVAALVLLAANALFLRLTRIAPPKEALALLAQTEKPPLVARGTRAFVGENWAGRERGIWEYHLAGPPVAMGYAHARLGTHLLMDTEDYMFGEMRRYVPSRIAMSLIRLGVLYRYRNLLDHVSGDLRFEIAGLAAGQPDLHADFLPGYHRFVFYHALHDITQSLEHSPLLGCTAFAAAGAATPSGHVIVGRNFDFEGPPMFDREKAVLFFKPQGSGTKLPFASVAWTGMIGVVTGINVAGIYVSVNALRSVDKSNAGVPVELLLREVLESAHTLDEALEIVKTRAVLVPDLYLIADGKSGEAAVVERSPTRAAVRRSKDLIAVANHALSPEFAGDVENERLKNYLTSGARMARVEELLAEKRGKIDPAMALSILRDKRGTSGKDLGLGNRNALDAIIATHSVVIDATDLVIWVGIGPHALGRYVAFDLRRELLGDTRPQPLDLDEDPTLHSAAYREFLQAEHALAASTALEGHGELTRAIEEAERAVALLPLSADARKRLADLLYLRKQGDDLSRGRVHYQTFLTLSPPYRRDIETVQALLNK